MIEGLSRGWGKEWRYLESALRKVNVVFQSFVNVGDDLRHIACSRAVHMVDVTTYIPPASGR
jgi:hypothetical protein